MRMDAYFIILLAIILTSCRMGSKPKHNGFVLQQFEVVNDQLKSIINSVKDSARMIKDGDHTMILVLRTYDSNPEFCFTSAMEKDISEKYIFYDNRRIVGFIDNNGKTVIVLSTESSKFQFEMNFYKFLIPTKNTRYFEYIYFPDNQYFANEKGIGHPPKIFDPYYYYYACKNDTFIPMTYGRE